MYDLSQVLEEIAEQPEIEEAASEPMLFIELVLKVPQLKEKSPKMKSPYKRRRSSQADLGNPLTSRKKVVKFSAGQQSSGWSSSY